MPKKPNVLLLAIDSIRADHMSCYGYERLTTPYIDRFAAGGTLFENTFSAHIPTTPAYASMLTGRDCFGTQVVALRHQGPLRAEAPTAAEIFRSLGYDTTCVGFSGNPSGRGFDTYIDYYGWGSYAAGRSYKAQNLNEVALPELERIMKLDEGVLRYLIVVNEGEPTSGMSVVATASRASGAPEESDADADEQDGEDEADTRSGMSPPEFSGGRGHRRRIEGPPITVLNYKDVATLSPFVTEQGKLLPRRTTRVAAGFQRKLGRAVKRARYLALLPYVRRHEG